MFNHMISSCNQEIEKRIYDAVKNAGKSNLLDDKLIESGFEINDIYSADSFKHFECTATFKKGDVEGLLVPFTATVSFDVFYDVNTFLIEGKDIDAYELYVRWHNGDFDVSQIYAL